MCWHLHTGSIILRRGWAYQEGEVVDPYSVTLIFVVGVFNGERSLLEQYGRA